VPCPSAEATVVANPGAVRDDRGPAPGTAATHDEEEPVAYDHGNPFARILRGELPCERLFETEFALAITDRDPQAPYHALVLAKGHYETMDQFAREATPEQLVGFWRAVSDAADKLGIAETGYRVIVNQGVDAGQQVPHLHVHVVGGADLGPIVARAGMGLARLRGGRREPIPSLPGEASERNLKPRPGHDPKSKPLGGPDA
jgi:histidine triad (HIT) family protein